MNYYTPNPYGMTSILQSSYTMDLSARTDEIMLPMKPAENRILDKGQDLYLQKIYDASAYRGTGIEYLERELPPKRMIVYYMNPVTGFDNRRPIAIFYIERGRKKPEIVYLPGSERIDTDTKKKIRKTLYEEVNEVIGLADMNLINLTGGKEKEYIRYKSRRYVICLENRKKYIVSKGEKIFLESIRGKYEKID